jgi:hypothetical protein
MLKLLNMLHILLKKAQHDHSARGCVLGTNGTICPLQAPVRASHTSVNTQEAELTLKMYRYVEKPQRVQQPPPGCWLFQISNRRQAGDAAWLSLELRMAAGDGLVLNYWR